MKIDTNGNFTPFYGWTLISNVLDTLSHSCIYNYISNNNTLQKYFVALPIDSYHMTIYNIWSNGKNLIQYQENYLKYNFNVNDQQILREQSKKIGRFNPNGFMDGLIENIQYIVNKDNTEEKIDQYMFVNCAEIKYTGSTLCAMVEGDFLKPNRLRERLFNYLNTDDNMDYYHITIAYQYRLCIEDDDISLINAELNILNIIMKNIRFNLSIPFVATFNDMTKFIPCFNREKYCHIYLVPDQHTQIELTKFGFDITAPMTSYRENPTLKEKNTKFGGAHVSIVNNLKYTYNCHKQLKDIAIFFKSQTNKNWSLPIFLTIERTNFQSNLIFNCPILENTIKFAQMNGINNLTRNELTTNDGFRIGFYGSTLGYIRTIEEESGIVNSLLQAKWGFILSIDNADNNFIFDWNSFIAI